MSNAEIRGRFIWHELMTTDPDAAAGFYSKVVPWKTQPSGMPSYRLWMTGKRQAGGLTAQPDDARQAGAAPSWLVYIGSPDVDSTAAAAQRLGGKVLKSATDIPGIGRFAVLADPQGAAFAVFSPAAPPGASAAARAGEFSWHELATTDPQAAIGFYSELFAWTRGPAHDMGPAGSYQIIEHEGKQVGGMYALRDASTPSRWLSYIRVASADRAAAAARAGGGRVAQGPMEVPGGSRVAQILDPQGGAFAVHELARAAAQAAPEKSAPAAAPEAKPAKRAAPREAAKKSAAGSAPSRGSKRPAAKRRKARSKRPAGKSGSRARSRAASRRRAAPSRSAARKTSGRGRAATGRSKPRSRRRGRRR